MTQRLHIPQPTAATAASSSGPQPQGSAPCPHRSVLVCGVGSVGRPLALQLSRLEVTHLSLVDPKYYFAHSVDTQCETHEVHRCKVDVVAALAEQAGRTTVAYPTDICALPDGVLRDGALLISCTDNTRALVRTNRLAARMGSPLLKVNIEPRVSCVSVRAYEPCHEAGPCAECQLSDRHYENQTHPHSCDGQTTARRTAGSRELALAAAQLAVRAAADILDAGPAAREWYGWETQYSLDSKVITRSRLERYADCRWDHSARWENRFRLAESPADVRLAQLIPLPCRRSLDDVVIDFDHAVTRWVCCNQCPRRVRRTHWITSLSTTLGNCPTCGSWLVPFPFGVRQRATGRQLRDVLDRPLADWGVAPGAVIRVTHVGHIRTFVLGPTSRPLPPVSEREEHSS